MTPTSAPSKLFSTHGHRAPPHGSQPDQACRYHRRRRSVCGQRPSHSASRSPHAVHIVPASSVCQFLHPAGVCARGPWIRSPLRLPGLDSAKWERRGSGGSDSTAPSGVVRRYSFEGAGPQSEAGANRTLGTGLCARTSPRYRSFLESRAHDKRDTFFLPESSRLIRLSFHSFECRFRFDRRP
jgi:hypothetical protein